MLSWVVHKSRLSGRRGKRLLNASRDKNERQAPQKEGGERKPTEIKTPVCWPSSCVTPAGAPTYTERCRPASRIDARITVTHIIASQLCGVLAPACCYLSRESAVDISRAIIPVSIHLNAFHTPTKHVKSDNLLCRILEAGARLLTGSRSR